MPRNIAMAEQIVYSPEHYGSSAFGTLVCSLEERARSSTSVFPIKEYFDHVRAAADRTLEQLNTSASSDAAITSKIMDTLGDALCSSVVVLSKVASCYGFETADAYHSAVVKVRGRTPYMQEWGDGSVAATAQAAKDLWKERKAQEKVRKAAEQDIQDTSCAETARDDLVFTIGRLVALDGCPWTSVQDAADLVRYLQDESAEAMDELDALIALDANSDKADYAQQTAAIQRALVSELGDMMFCVLMAVFLAGRDYAFGLSDLCLRTAESVEKLDMLAVRRLVDSNSLMQT